MKIELDASKIQIDKNGVQNFLWPIQRSELLAVRDTTFTELVRTAREIGIGQGQDGQLLQIVMGWFLNEVMVGYRAVALERRLDDLGSTSGEVTGSRFSRAILEKNPNIHSPFLDRIRNGPAISSKWTPVPTKWRPSLRGIRSGNFSLTEMRPVNFFEDVVSIQQLPLTQLHSKLVEANVRNLNIGDLISPLTGDCNRDSSHLSSMLDKSIEAARAGFAIGDESMPQFFEEFLRDWLVTSTGMIKVYLEAIAVTPDRIPRKLWTGSGGPIFTRILRHAVKNVGGEVTGHDHAVGTGFLEFTSKMITDFVACDTFVTFTKAQAINIEKTIQHDQLVSDKPPIIASLSRDQSATHQLQKSNLDRRTRISPPIKTLMYTSSFYRGEKYPFGVPLSDIVALDWEARLFAHMSSAGYKILQKPHPSSIAMPLEESFQSVGAKLITQPFEEVDQLADAFMFIHTQSTTFRSIMASDKPVIFIDIGLFNWIPEAYEMLQRRCRVVRGWFDDNNRVEVNWEDLVLAVNEARYLDDDSFYQTYLKSVTI